MTWRAFAWLGMTLLALVVAAYTGMILFVPGARPPFVATHLVERPLASYLHFLGGAIAIVAGAFQLNSRLRNRYIGIHRWLGRLYLLAVVLGGVTGFALAMYSMGGVIAHVGFGLLALCSIGSTVAAYLHIRAGRQSAHRRWMIRSYALMFAAVMLRIYLPSSMIAGIPMSVAYPVIAWICWIPNLLVAEWFVRSPRSFAMSPESSLEPKPLGGSA